MNKAGNDLDKPMRALVVSCHPLENSLCAGLTAVVIEELEQAGADVFHVDLYDCGLDPVMPAGQRQTYFSGSCDVSGVEKQIEQLAQADLLALVFPVWWSGFPALLKGWFDRVWIPGVAYQDMGPTKPIKSGLVQLKKCIAVNTMGSPWWVDRFVLNQPLRKIVARGLIGPCTSGCKLRQLTLYDAQDVKAGRADRFKRKVRKAVQGIV